MYPTKTPGSVFRVALLIACGVASVGYARPARADQSFPAALAAAAPMPCVPQCTVCHRDNLGGARTLIPFGLTMQSVGGLVGAGNPALVAPALKKVADAMTDTDGDGISDIDELKVGDSPSIKGAAGQGEVCAGAKYGCGAHIAAPPPVDRFSLFSAGLVVLGLAAARRRRSSGRTQA